MTSVLSALVLLFAGTASAQEPTAPPDRVDVDPFTPSSSLAVGFGTIQGEAPWLGAEGLSLGLHSAVAENPAVFRYATGGESPMVEQLLLTELAAGWTLNDRARIDLAVPFYPYVKSPWQGHQGPAMGDIRVRMTLPLVGEPGDKFGFALVPTIGAPTGTRWSYTRRGVHGGLLGAMGGESGKFGWIGNVGFTFSGTDAVEGVTMGSTFDLVGGAFFAAKDDLRFGADLSANLGLASGRTGTGNSRGELDLFAQTHLKNGLGMTIGAGTGLIGGVGAPDWRMFASFTYGFNVRDSDGDGLLDDLDSCPIDPEDFDQWLDEDGCPEADNDNDGFVDTSDSCPNEAEDADGFQDEGCPDPDNDLDTVLDEADACPLVAGPVEFMGCPDTDKDGLQDSEDQCPEEAGPKETGGCPDRDKDQVPDFRDKCPDVKKPPDEDPATSDGCPKRVYVTKKAVKITDKVFFETGKAVIKPESFGLLDDVAKVLDEAVWVQKVEVGGHTDDKGSDESNQTLSQRRAQAVMDYLVKKGVEKERLVAKGYGETTPIDTNRTEDGRQNNRRVEFLILAQDASRMPKPTGSLTPIVPPKGPGTTGTTGTGTTGTTATTGTTGTTATTGTTGTTGTTATTVDPATPGKLTVNLAGVGFADVYIDDVRISKTAPFKDFTIAPGQHLIVVVNNRAGLTYEQTVTVGPGESVVVNAVKGGAAPPPPPPPPPDGGGDSPWGPIPQ